jgi:hypothetical protein
LGHDKKLVNIATLFGYLEEADITRQLEDAEWSDAAFALYRNDDRAVQFLIDLVHRGSGREHPRIMLADFLSIKGHVCEVAKRALSAVQVRPSTGPPALPLDGEMSWCETKEVLGLASDGELHAIWKICLERGVTGKRRHAFTRESVNALLGGCLALLRHLTIPMAVQSLFVQPHRAWRDSFSTLCGIRHCSRVSILVTASRRFD